MLKLLNKAFDPTYMRISCMVCKGRVFENADCFLLVTCVLGVKIFILTWRGGDRDHEGGASRTRPVLALRMG